MLYYKFFNSHLNRYAAELNRGNRDRGVLNKFLCGKAPPRGPTPNVFVYYFFTKKVFLSYTFY